MNIHTYEKLWLVAAMVLIVGFIATITYGSVALGITMVGDQEPTVEPGELNDDERFGDPGVEHVGENQYDAYVVAQTFAFRPEVLEVPANSDVTFYVTSRDVIHSYSVVGTNINTMVIPGEVAQMTVEFDDPGEYGVVCNEYCGFNHHEMEGQIHVVPEDEFTLTELSATAPDEVTLDEDVTIDVTVQNGLLDDIETEVTLESANETMETTLSVAGDTSEETTFTLEASELGEGDHDWTVTADGEEVSGTVTVMTDSEDDADDAAATGGDADE